MNATLDEVIEFARKQNQEAREGARQIVFRESLEFSASGKLGGIRGEAPSLADVEHYEVLKHATGLSAWAVILAVDMRDSSRRATDIGAEHMYVTMHTFLPTLAHLVEKADGKVVGLRGDGLFAAFGVTELQGQNNDVTPEDSAAACRNALGCGKGMIEAVQDAINPILIEDRIQGGIQIGVGISVGNVVITRIGWESANELTVYGSPVNQACKELATSSNRDGVRVTRQFRQIYPSEQGGTMGFTPIGSHFAVNFPTGYFSLQRRRTPR